jgi:hypothetical protein
MVWKCHSTTTLPILPCLWASYGMLDFFSCKAFHTFIHIWLQMWKGEEANLKGSFSCACCKLLQIYGEGDISSLCPWFIKCLGSVWNLFSWAPRNFMWTIANILRFRTCVASWSIFKGDVMLLKDFKFLKGAI